MLKRYNKFENEQLSQWNNLQQLDQIHSRRSLKNNFNSLIAQDLRFAKIKRSSARYKQTSNQYIRYQIIDKLAATNNNFKYIVNCVLVAKGGNGLDVGGLCYWNPEMDGSIAIKW